LVFIRGGALCQIYRGGQLEVRGGGKKKKPAGAHRLAFKLCRRRFPPGGKKRFNKVWGGA